MASLLCIPSCVWIFQQQQQKYIFIACTDLFAVQLWKSKRTRWQIPALLSEVRQTGNMQCSEEPFSKESFRPRANKIRKSITFDDHCLGAYIRCQNGMYGVFFSMFGGHMEASDWPFKQHGHGTTVGLSWVHRLQCMVIITALPYPLWLIMPWHWLTSHKCRVCKVQIVAFRLCWLPGMTCLFWRTQRPSGWVQPSLHFPILCSPWEEQPKNLAQ